MNMLGVLAATGLGSLVVLLVALAVIHTDRALRRRTAGRMTLRELETFGKDRGVRPRKRLESYAAYRALVTDAAFGWRREPAAGIAARN